MISFVDEVREAVEIRVLESSVCDDECIVGIKEGGSSLYVHYYVHYVNSVCCMRRGS